LQARPFAARIVGERVRKHLLFAFKSPGD